MNNILQIIRTCSIISIVLLLSQQLFAPLGLLPVYGRSQPAICSSLTVLGLSDMISNPKMQDLALRRDCQATNEPVGLQYTNVANPLHGRAAGMDAGWKSVVITEIFPDPSPSQGLPSYEYLEILNRSGSSINVEGWQLRDESATMVLPELELATGRYLILSNEPVKFGMYGQAVGSGNFPSLNNTGDVIRLLSANGDLIDSVHYKQSWYRDRERSNGGWSLELIDPENGCGDQQNWVVSEDSSGGTPGRQNSVYAEKPDLTAPILLSVLPMNDQLLRVRFDERLSNRIPESTCFIFNPPLNIDTITFADQSLMLLDLTIVDGLQSGVTYKLGVTDIRDCAGNAVQNYSQPVIFGKPETASSGDIVINEILFNPTPQGVDFIEVLNASGKFINISKWWFASFEDRMISDSQSVANNYLLMPPHSYLAVTERADLLTSAYPFSHTEHILQVDRLPPMNDDQGSIALVDANDSIMDKVDYSASMHSVFIRDPEGVSLERVSPLLPASDTHNWKSGAANAGFATPGYINSNASQDPPLAAGNITVDPKAFIPLTGQPNFTRIAYVFDQGGYVANVNVYDERGRLIKQITHNEILGTQGGFNWEGDRDDGYRARTGYYLIRFEIFDATGVVRIFKNSVAVASRF